ncbi:ABC transporter ATP-binding protein, partial [Streptomyces sp. SID11233]|nr:ABC transporter ATP-binding protein [Streptomyces sp. SID11233]
SDRVAVLVQGQKLLEGTPDIVQADERVIAAYLGTPMDTAPEDEALAEVQAAEAAATKTDTPRTTKEDGK